MLVFLVFFLSCYPSCYVSTALNHNRRMLHQPLLFFTQGSSPPSLPPSLPPEPDQPQFPFTPSTNNNNNNNNNYNNYPFFPSVFSPPPPPQQPQQQPQQQQPQISDSPNTLTTLPANISSLLVPHYPHKDHHSPKTVLVVVAVAVTAFVLVGLSILLLILVVRRRGGGGIDKDVASSLDSHRLYPANIAHSDGQEEEEDGGDGGRGRAVAAAPNTAEFLHLGTLSTPRGGGGGSNGANWASPYRKVGSPELHPLPPLSRSVPRSAYRNGNVGSSSSSSSSASSTSTDEGEPNDHQFYSPRVEVKDLKSNSNSNSNPNSPTRSDSPSSLASTNGSIKPICISRLKSPHEPPLPVSTLPTSPLNLREQIPTHVSGPPILVAPSGSANFLKKTSGNQAEAPQNPPNLKPLCGDVVGESTDQLKSRTLKKSNSTSEETTRREIGSRENAVLDMKKSQSIAILLRALNMSTEEVCQALMEGNAGTLGTDLLGTLLRMAPTKDEEFKLKECKHDSLCNLGPAEQFLKAVLDIPFAFRRLDAMLYIANFDSEVEYLRMSFEILKIACQELRNSRMFQKFLQAMVNMRNRVNVANEAGTFELETLLKPINAEGPDGKTILLNFVIKEITRDEGIQDDDVELGKLKWNVIDDINMELINVKKAAEMDSFALINDVSELVCGIKNVGEVVRLNETTGSKESNQRFSESMNKFLKKAEGHITRIQAHQSAAFFLVEEVTAYFHVNSAKKLADPFIIFKVVSDFLSILNQACKEVDKNNEQATFNTDNINTKTAV